MNNIKNTLKYSKDLHLLYVEDNMSVRVATYSALKFFFETITVAVDGADGLEKFKENSIDIIITDIDMPNMDGLEMLQYIKNIDDQVPVLIFSAYSSENYFIDAIKLGVDGYLMKPIDLEQFNLTLDKSIEKLVLRKENLDYKNNLEEKVAHQQRELMEKDMLLMQHSKMAAMGEMIDTIAHQWKQPLNAIMMMSELLINTSDTKDIIINVDDIQAYQVDIKQQIDHLVDTLNEFRSFFIPNNNMNRFALKSIFASISLLLNDELISNQTQLEIECEDDIFLVANENDIKHLFINLITNAKEEMVLANVDSRQRIVSIKCIKKENKIEIILRDNGRGISKEIIDDIFKSKFSTKVAFGGSGVGLYISKLIIEKYMGKIEVSNDNGAVFKIVLRDEL